MSGCITGANALSNASVLLKHHCTNAFFMLQLEALESSIKKQEEEIERLKKTHKVEWMYYSY